MPSDPRASGREVVRALERAGWHVHRVRGSHYVMKSPLGHRVSVPVHGNKTLPIGTMGSIMEQCQIPVADFEALLRGRRL